MFRHKCERHMNATSVIIDGRAYRTCMRCFQPVLDPLSAQNDTMSQEQLIKRASAATASIPDFEAGVPKQMDPEQRIKPQNVVKMTGTRG